MEWRFGFFAGEPNVRVRANRVVVVIEEVVISVESIIDGKIF
jgi:hypothetical protein